MSQLSNRKSDLEQLEALKSQVLEKYNSASPELQAKAAKVASSYRQYYDADPLRRGNAIELETDAYQRMSDILDGKTGYNEINAGTARTNAFGKYSSDEISNIGNEITRKALSQPAKSASSASAGSSGSAAGSSSSAGNSATTFYKFNWDKLNTDYLTPNSPLSERATSFISSLISNLQAALAAVNSGARIKGLDKQAIDKLPSIINGLNQIAYSNVNWNTENLEELDGVVSLLKRYAQDLNLPVEYFSNYFNEWFDPSEAMTNKRGLIAKNYKFENPYGENTYIKNLLDKHGWKTATKDGKTYVFDSNWKAIDTPYSEIFDDASKADTYGKGLFINGAGQIVYGSVDSLIGDDLWKDLVDTSLKSLIEKRDPTHYSYDFNSLYSTSNSDLVNRVADHLGNNFTYHDISAQFSGKTPVIAVGPNNKKLTTDRYGNLQYPEGTKFYFEKDGKLLVAQSPQSVAKTIGENYDYRGYAGDSSNSYETEFHRDLLLKGETSLTGEEDFLGRSFGKHFVTYAFLDDIKDDPETWVKMMLLVLSNPDGYDNDKYDKSGTIGRTNRDVINDLGGIKNIIPYVVKLIEENNMQLSNNERSKLRGLIKTYLNTQASPVQSAVQSEKLGGIVKMAEGQVVDYFGNPVTPSSYASTTETKAKKNSEAEVKLAEESAKAGYDNTSVYKANMRKPGDAMSPTDFVRFGALAADIASIPAAWVPGFGSAVSAGLGIGSSFATLFTDITEDGFQFHDLTGLGINLAMDAAGVITGGAGKIAKIVKGAIKFSPFLFAAWEGMAHGDLYAAALNKLTSKEKMTVQDWRTLAAGVSLIAGMNRSSASMYKQRQIKNNANLDKLARSGKLQEREIEVKGKDGKVEKLKLNPEQVRQVAEAKNLEEVNAIIKGINKDYSVKTDSKVPGLKNKNPFKDWRAELKEAKINPTQDEVRGAMLKAKVNQKYLGEPQKGDGFLTKYLVNPVNRTGLKYGLASDMDIAVGNTSGFLGLYKGNNNTEKYTSAYNKLLNDIEAENTKTANEAAKTANKATKASKSQFTPREARVLKQIYKSAGVKNRKEFAKKYQTKGHEVKDLDKMEEALLTSYRGTQKTFELNDLKIKEALTAERKPYTKVSAKDRIARMSALLHENAEAHYDPKVTFRDLQRQYHFKSGGHIDRMKAFINNRQHES